LSAFPFSQGIDLKQNMRYAKYVLPVVFVFLAVALWSPNILKQGTERIVYYDKQFK
jgi:hypothetical protein